MKGFLGPLVSLVVVSLFLGFIIVALAIGAIFPSINKLTAPLICRGEVQVETTRYSYKPGQVGWYHEVFCTNEAGVRREITSPAFWVTGLAGSAAVLVLILVFAGKWWFSREPATPRAAPEEQKDSPALERLAELKRMRDENLISEAEYDRKKAEILEAL